MDQRLIHERYSIWVHNMWWATMNRDTYLQIPSLSTNPDSSNTSFCSFLSWTFWSHIQGIHPESPGYHSSWLCSWCYSFFFWLGTSYNRPALVHLLSSKENRIFSPQMSIVCGEWHILAFCSDNDCEPKERQSIQYLLQHSRACYGFIRGAVRVPNTKYPSVSATSEFLTLAAFSKRLAQDVLAFLTKGTT